MVTLEFCGEAMSPVLIIIESACPLVVLSPLDMLIRFGTEPALSGGVGGFLFLTCVPVQLGL